MFGSKKMAMIEPEKALRGRSESIVVPPAHFVNGHTLEAPFPEGLRLAQFAMGCFWGAERIFWQTSGVYSTAVGYSGGYTPNPTYEETCSGQTGHTEAVLVVYDPTEVAYEQLLKVFWESHDPTQGMRQGNDMGSQYRSALYYYDDGQRIAAEASREQFQAALAAKRYSEITTEFGPAPTFYYAEPYHQQYLAKVPNGYCGLGGTGVSCPIGVASLNEG